MITPKKLESYANNEIVNIYTELNEQLTKEIIKSIKSEGDISSYTKHQLKVLIKNGGKDIFNKALMKTQKLTAKRKKEISKLFDDLVNEQYNGYEDMYKRKDIEYSISEESLYVASNIQRAVNKELNNLTRTIAFETKKEYVNAMDNLYKKIVSGGWSYDKAIKSTILDLVDKGITLKKDGTKYRLESKVRNDIFSSVRDLVRKIDSNIGDELGLDYVWIDITPYCRPSHRPINGVKMKRSTFESKYEYLTEEYNCYHQPISVDKEFVPLTSQSEINRANSNLEKRYKERQKQNYYARQVREKKRDIASVGNTNKDILKEKKKQLRNAQIKYRIFSLSNGFDVDYSQTWEAGYNGSRNR